MEYGEEQIIISIRFYFDLQLIVNKISTNSKMNKYIEMNLVFVNTFYATDYTHL